MPAPVLQNLAFYTLAGQPASSRDLVAEVVEAEALGLGTAFISERYNKKEAATLSGAAGAVSTRITISTAAAWKFRLPDTSAMMKRFFPVPLPRARHF